MKSLFLLLLFAAAAAAQMLDPESTGRAGVHHPGLKGASALGWNPAALSPDRGFRMTFELPSLTGALGNNAFSVNFWNNHIAGDRFLTDDDIDAILNRFPADKLRAYAQVTVPVAGFTYNRFGLRAVVENSNQTVLPRDLAELALKGNRLYQRYGIGDLRAESETIVNYTVGFGYRFEQEEIPDLHFGAGFHFYQGVFLAKLEQADGGFIISDSLIQGGSVLHSVTSDRGDGVGFDLAALAAISEKLEVGLALRQLGSKLTWTVDRNDRVSFYADSAGIIIDSLDDDDYLERAFHYQDTSYSGGAVETRLPVVIEATGLYRLDDAWRFMGEVSVRTQSSVQGPGGIGAGAAAEYIQLSPFVLQGGLSLGGPWRSRFGLGFALRFRNYDLTLGGTWNGGLFNSAHGLSFGMSQRLKF